MEKENKLNKITRLGYISTLLVLILTFTSSGNININHAKIIHQDKRIKYELPKKEFAYTFKIADKLTGEGQLELSIEENKIIGIANGTGKVCQCNVDFLTSIEGNLDKSNGAIDVVVNGKGNPEGLIPGKVTFKGPLKGSLNDKKLSLAGKVKIDGYLARSAGFNNTEDVLIEIDDAQLVKTIKKLKFKNRLASL